MRGAPYVLVVLLCSVLAYSSDSASANSPLKEFLSRVTQSLPSGIFGNTFLRSDKAGFIHEDRNPQPVYGEHESAEDVRHSSGNNKIGNQETFLTDDNATFRENSGHTGDDDGNGQIHQNTLGSDEKDTNSQTEDAAGGTDKASGYFGSAGMDSRQFGGSSLFGFDSIVFGLALSAFGAFLVQFIVNLVRAGRRKKRSLDGSDEHEHLLDMFTRWVMPVIHGDYATIWNDLDPENEGVFSLMYRSLPDLEYMNDANIMLTQFAAMGEAMRDGFLQNESLFPENGGMLTKDVHRKLCRKYSLGKNMDRVHARISKYYWFALSHTGLMSWAEPYLKSIGHGLDERDCEEWPESETHQEPLRPVSSGTYYEYPGAPAASDLFEVQYVGPGDVLRSRPSANSAPFESSSREADKADDNSAHGTGDDIDLEATS